MKKFSKILSVALLVALVLSLGVANAFADSSITIDRHDSYDAEASGNTQYTYYQILKADLSALTASDYDENGAPKEGSKVVYYVDNADLASALSGTGVFTVTQVEGSSRYNVVLVDGKTAADLVTALNVPAVTGKALSTGTFSQEADGSVTQSGLNDGYYLIVASNGKNVVLQTIGNVRITEKNDYPTVDKKIKEGTELVTENDVNIGDPVTYVVPVKIPEEVAQKPIVITDKMHKGLTLNKTSLEATNGTDAVTELTFVDGATATEDNPYNVYTITIPAETVFANKGKTITLTYSAVLNANAVIASTGNPNTVKLEYDNYVTPEHEVKTYTYKVEINKINGADNTKLDGAKFTLTRTVTKTVGSEEKEVTEYYVTKNGDASVWSETKTEFTTNKTDNLVFDGLDAGTYTLTETEAPKGFNPLSGPITVTIAKGGAVTYKMPGTETVNNATDLVIPVENNSGTVLPSTGGIGTTIFYVVGGVLVLAAIILLVTKKRMSE